MLAAFRYRALALWVLAVSVHLLPPLTAHAAPPATTSPATYQNPIFDRDFPDPNLERGRDGYIYAYSTQTGWTDMGPKRRYIVPIIRSKDLVHWDLAGTVFSAMPAWKRQGGIWAPDVTYYKGEYYCYYAYSIWNDPNPGIGLATAFQAGGPWTDHGKVFLSSEIKVNNSIDPFLLVDGGRMYLFWGSFAGIYGVQLSPDGTRPAGQKFQIAGFQFEASYILKKNGYYYFFGSSGSCCEGATSSYHVQVGRAKNLRGPYLDKDGKSLIDGGGTEFLHADAGGKFAGPGHNADIITDDAGVDWILYHAYRKSDPARGRVLLMDRVDWVDGWPKIANDEPSTTVQPAPTFKAK